MSADTALDTLLAALERARPALASRIVREVGAASARITSPREASRDVVLWVDPGDDLGLGFGRGWHTHGNIAHWHRAGHPTEIDALVALVLAIVDGEIVLARDVGGAFDGAETILDHTEPDALLEALTQRRAPPRLLLLAWSGEGDREVGLDDLASGGEA
jgi:hypothetical protein